MKEARLLVLLLAICPWAIAQEAGCKLVLSGHVLDTKDHKHISGSQVTLADGKQIAVNRKGEFRIANLCPGSVTFTVTHLAYEGQTRSYNLQQDTLVDIYLKAKSIQLKEVLVHSNKDSHNSVKAATLSLEQRRENQGKNLAEQLANIAGVNILRTGTNIAKPVVNGLFGNRLIMLNNGVRHESQQWGTDHAPEIDPFAGEQIELVKNADAVRYGADALGGIIKVTAKPLTAYQPFRVSSGLILNSNGRSAALNTQLEGSVKRFTYNLGLTGKMGGNMKTADYYLGNTGNREFNGNLSMGYSWTKNTLNVYASHFGNEIAIFEGAHAGTKEDIFARIANGRPFETYNFSYSIQAPRQRVYHDLGKLLYTHRINEKSSIEAQYSYQRNHRLEYDRRRVQDDDVPMADMILTTQQLEAVYKNGMITTGISGSLQVNNNTPGTGTTPIIPNFDNHTLAAFYSQKIPLNRSMLEYGIRYDYKYFDAAGYRFDYNHPASDGSIPQYLMQNKREFHNVSGLAGLAVPLSNTLAWKSNLGLAWRAPSANELYSDGIHHGTGTYEVGNKDLKSEKGYKWLNSLTYNKKWLQVNVDVFGQLIANYIYSQPNPDSVRQTIRGTFPLFQYQQNKALFYGTDVSANIHFGPHWSYQAQLSLVRAKNMDDNRYLPNIPGDKIQQNIAYRFQVNGAESYIKLKHLYQLRQYRYEPGSDFAVPPPAYHVFDLIGSTTLSTKKQQQTSIQLAVENLFNTSYKDYMDRFRYYAHALGTNISLKINHTF
ncbi:TonB-dependent receptor [Sphingobacterium sp. Mn56C]|uniref:TonB-dependent receptor n=1 Tax=Sphingobacterium sp. Mn56C TaxID=3395261 RepID=UPI003BBFA48B